MTSLFPIESLAVPVTQVTVTTKTEEDDVSTQYSLSCTGQIVSQKPSHLGRGQASVAQSLLKDAGVRFARAVAQLHLFVSDRHNRQRPEAFQEPSGAPSVLFF